MQNSGSRPMADSWKLAATMQSSAETSGSRPMADSILPATMQSFSAAESSGDSPWVRLLKTLVAMSGLMQVYEPSMRDLHAYYHSRPQQREADHHGYHSRFRHAFNHGCMQTILQLIAPQWSKYMTNRCTVGNFVEAWIYRNISSGILVLETDLYIRACNCIAAVEVEQPEFDLNIKALMVQKLEEMGYELWQGDLWLRDQYGWYQYIDFKTDDQFVQCWSRLGRASPLMGHAPVPLYI